MAENFRSMAQLRNQTWTSYDAAVKELKRNTFPERGADYYIGETSPGSQVWMLRDVTDAEPPLNTGKKKSPIERIKAAGPKPGRETLPKKKRRSADGQLGPQEPEHKSDDPVVDWVINNTVQHRPTPDKPTDDLPKNDMTALPNESGPYSIRTADLLAQHAIVELAVKWSVLIGQRLALADKDGKVVRVIDGRLAVKRSRVVERRKGAQRVPGEGTNRARCSALLLRDEGAKLDELVGIIGRKPSMSFIRRLASIHQAAVEEIGTNHWRLVKKP